MSPLVLPARRKPAASPTASSNASPSSLNPNLKLMTTQQVRTEGGRYWLERSYRNPLLVFCLPAPWYVRSAVRFLPTLAEGRHPSALHCLGSKGGIPRAETAQPSVTVMLSPKKSSRHANPRGVPRSCRSDSVRLSSFTRRFLAPVK